MNHTVAKYAHEPNGTAWVWLAAVVKLHFDNSMLQPPAAEYETFRACVEGYVDFLAEEEATRALKRQKRMREWLHSHEQHLSRRKTARVEPLGGRLDRARGGRGKQREPIVRLRLAAGDNVRAFECARTRNRA